MLCREWKWKNILVTAASFPQNGRSALIFMKRENLVQVFPCEFQKYFRNVYGNCQRDTVGGSPVLIY